MQLIERSRFDTVIGNWYILSAKGMATMAPDPYKIHVIIKLLTLTNTEKSVDFLASTS